MYLGPIRSEAVTDFHLFILTQGPDLVQLLISKTGQKSKRKTFEAMNH